MSRYRIVERIDTNGRGEKFFTYSPQYKFLGLIWIPIKNKFGFYHSSILFDRAKETIEIHKSKKFTSTRSIIEIED